MVPCSETVGGVHESEMSWTTNGGDDSGRDDARGDDVGVPRRTECSTVVYHADCSLLVDGHGGSIPILKFVYLTVS